MHLGSVSRRRETTGMVVRNTPLVRTPPMPSLHALANYVLEPANNVSEIRDDVPEEMREDEGALSRRIRREESALRRGMEFGTGLFEEEDNGGSGSDTTEYAPAVFTARNSGGRRADGDGFVVVPDLGDRDVESEVHAVLAVHGIQSRLSRRRSYDDDAEREVDLDEYGDDYPTETDRDTNTGSTHGDYDYSLYRRRFRRRRGPGGFTTPSGDAMVFDETEEDAVAEEDNRMDVDDIPEEEDADCISNDNSRSASPTVGSASDVSLRNGGDNRSEDDFECGFDDADTGAYYTGSLPSSSLAKPPNLTCYDDIDIAGLCFDPWGERLYVAGTGTGFDTVGRDGLFSGAFGSPASARSPFGHSLGTVIEWGVRGAEKRFWVDEGWM